MGLYKNNQGFTLLSTLFAFSIIIITLPFLSSLLDLVNTDDNYDALSVRRYFSFMRDEAIQAQDWSIEDKHLKMTLKNNETVVFDQRGELIYRRVNGGNEIYLRDVKDVWFEDLSYGFRIRLKTLQGDEYAKIITVY